MKTCSECSNSRAAATLRVAPKGPPRRTPQRETAGLEEPLCSLSPNRGRILLQSAARVPLQGTGEKRNSEASPVQTDGSADIPRRVGTLPLPAGQGMAQEEQGRDWRRCAAPGRFSLLLLPECWAGNRESQQAAEPTF